MRWYGPVDTISLKPIERHRTETLQAVFVQLPRACLDIAVVEN